MTDTSLLISDLWKAFPWAAIVALLGLMWKTRVPMRKIQDDADKSLRADLLKQLADQEATHKLELGKAEQRIMRLEDRIEDQRIAYETKLDRERIEHAGEMAVFRHRVNNLDNCLTFLLVLIETNPEKAQEAARKTREMREKQEKAEAAEKTAISAAKISASGTRAAQASDASDGSTS